MISYDRSLLVSAVTLASLCALAAGCKKSSPSSPRGDSSAAASSDSAAVKPDPDPGPLADKGAACADANPMKNVYFGELHTHTSYSLDAYSAGTRSDPSAAFAFGRGGKVRVAAGAPTPGPEVSIDRPLDFM